MARWSAPSRTSGPGVYRAPSRTYWRPRTRAPGSSGSETHDGTGSTSVAFTLTGSGEVSALAFPDGVLPLRVELDLGTWTDITAYVRREGGNGIQISRGRSPEAGRVEAASCTMTLDNRDGRFSPRNPVGAYYGLIGRNTPIRVGVDEFTSHLYCYGLGTALTCPDAAALDITGDIDVRIEADLPDWRRTMSLAGKWEDVSDQRSWALLIADDGLLTLTWTTAGTTATRLTATATAPLPSSGRYAVRATLDVNNGASGYDAKFWTADSISGSWTQLGATVTGTATTSIYSGTAIVEVGAVNDLVGDYPGVYGRLYALQVLSGIGGTVVANPDFTIQDAGDSSFADTASSPNTWTVQTIDAELSETIWRFHGEVSEWPPRWDISGRDAWVPIVAAGVLRRLGAGARALGSPMYRALTNLDQVAPPVAYWPCEDGTDATQIASGMDGVPAAKFYRETPSFGGDISFNCSSGLPTIQDSAWYGTVPAHSPTGEVQVRFLLHIDAAAVNGQRIFSVYTSGTCASLRLFYGTGGTLDLRAYDRDDALIASTGAGAFAADGKLLRLSIEAFETGGDVEFSVTSQEVGDPTNLGFAFSTAVGYTIGRTVGWGVNAGGGLATGSNKVTVGHISVHDAITTMLDLVEQLDGYIGETAAARIARLCEEEGVTYQQMYTPGASRQMGAQRSATLLDLLAECATTDRGSLIEPLDFLGLTYRPAASIQGQSARLTLDQAANEMAAQLEPADDDQGLTNRVTAKQVSGSSATVEISTGPLSTQDPPGGAGLYPSEVPVSVADEADLEGIASWVAVHGTVDEYRYPQVQVWRESNEVRANAAITTSLLDMWQNDRLVVTGPPAQLPPDDVDQIVYGWDEQLANFEHRFTQRCSPASPWLTAVADDDLYGVVDTDGSELAAGITDSATTITVTTTSLPAWTTDFAEFPFDITCGGEVMTVTAVATDGTFEGGTSGWTAVGGTIAQSSAQARTGTYSALMTTTGSPVQTYMRQTVQEIVTVGGVYTSSWWGYSAAGYATITVAIDWYDSGHNYLTGEYVSTSIAAGVWTRFSVTGTAPASTAYAVHGPTVGGSPAAGTALYVDDVVFSPAAAPFTQTFTVTRSVNGVVKTHSAGAEVRLAVPALVAL